MQGVVHGDLTSWNVLLDQVAKSTIFTPKARQCGSMWHVYARSHVKQGCKANECKPSALACIKKLRYLGLVFQPTDCITNI